MGIVAGLTAAAPAINAIGSVVGGIGSSLFGSNQAKKDRELQKKIAAGQQRTADENSAQSREQMRRQQQLTEGAEADRLNRQRQTNPMRDQVLSALMARTGMSPTAFQGRDIFNPGISANVPKLGGIDLNALAAQRAQYQPGDGGVNNNMEDQLLKNLGYTYGQNGQVAYNPIYDRPDIANPANIPGRPKKGPDQKAWDLKYGDSWARQHGGQTYQDVYKKSKGVGNLADILKNHALGGQG